MKTLNLKLKLISTLCAFISLLSIHAMAIPEGPDFKATFRNEALKYVNANGYSDNFLGQDGLKINYLVVKNPDEKGKLVVVPGKGEALVKYYELIYDVRHQGFSVYIIDHRGQGFSEKVLKTTPEMTHVKNFDDYVKDLETFVSTIVQPNSKTKNFLLAHSMGGLVATRFLQRNPNVMNAAVLSAPMIAPDTGTIAYETAELLVNVFSFLGQKEKYAKGQKPPTRQPEDYLTSTVSRSRDRVGMSNDINVQFPETVKGGTSWQWAKAVFDASMTAVNAPGNLVTPTMILQAGRDSYVRNDVQTEFCTRAKACSIIANFPLTNSLHEILMEEDYIRDFALSEIFKFFERF